MDADPDRDKLEQELRIEQMITNIEQMRANIDKTRQEMKYEARKFMIQLVLALAGAFGAGAAFLAAILAYFHK